MNRIAKAMVVSVIIMAAAAGGVAAKQSRTMTNNQYANTVRTETRTTEGSGEMVRHVYRSAKQVRHTITNRYQTGEGSEGTSQSGQQGGQQQGGR